VTALGDVLHLMGRYGYLVVFFGVMLESAGGPLPGETVLIAAGLLVHRGVLLGFGEALFFGILGAVVGDQFGYWAARVFPGGGGHRCGRADLLVERLPPLPDALRLNEPEHRRVQRPPYPMQRASLPL
jgi:hypothetical protein